MVNTHTIQKYAKQYLDQGLSILPLGCNKAPTRKWAQFQDDRMNADDVDNEFSASGVKGIGIIEGSISGNLEVIDVDDADVGQTYLDELNKRIPDLLASLPMVRTPKGGFHLYYRHQMDSTGNKKLAQRKTDDGVQVLIETRGEGGYVVAPGSPDDR